MAKFADINVLLPHKMPMILIGPLTRMEHHRVIQDLQVPLKEHIIFMLKHQAMVQVILIKEQSLTHHVLI